MRWFKANERIAIHKKQPDGGAWEPHSIACAGAWDYGEPGHLYEFRVTARDHVGNAARAVAQAGVPSVTKYYVHGRQRVALRRDGVIY